jgi:hypothetical protein
MNQVRPVRLGQAQHGLFDGIGVHCAIVALKGAGFNSDISAGECLNKQRPHSAKPQPNESTLLRCSACATRSEHRARSTEEFGIRAGRCLRR